MKVDKWLAFPMSGFLGMFVPEHVTQQFGDRVYVGRLGRVGGTLFDSKAECVEYCDQVNQGNPFWRKEVTPELLDAIEKYREAHQTYAGLLGDCSEAKEKVEEIEKKCQEQGKVMEECERVVMNIIREMAADPLPLKWRQM